MKPNHIVTFAIVLVIGSLLSPLAVNAQQAQNDTLYFNNGTGGSGTWENGAAGTPWLDNNNHQTVNWDNTVQTSADFKGTTSLNPGVVTVSGTVNVNFMNFESNYTLSGGAIYKNVETPNDNRVVVVSGNSDVTINNALYLDTTNASDQFDFNNGNGGTVGTGTLTINGPITYVGAGVSGGYRSLTFTDGNAAGHVVINSVISSGTTGISAELVFNNMASGSTVTLGPDTDLTNALPSGGKQMELASGVTIMLESSKLGVGQLTFIGAGGGAAGTGYTKAAMSLLTAGAQTITNTVGSQYYGNVIIGGTTADISTFTNTIATGQSAITVTAAQDGRVNFNGAIGVSVNDVLTGGLVKTGAGTVVLSHANVYNLKDPRLAGASGTVAADIQQGTLLITNTTGTAFGTNTGAVNVEAGATLGGSGISTQQVVAITGSSILSAGDAGQAALGINPSIASLNLSGGVSASNGLTMDFKLNGLTNDQIVVGTSFTLSGTITTNFTNLGDSTLSLLTPYTLSTGSGVWSDAGATFVTNIQPDGYMVNTAYGDNGYLFDAVNHTLTTEFTAVPEPSTYVMILVGLALLGFCVRRKLARA